MNRRSNQRRLARPLFKNGKCYNKVADGRVYPKRDNEINCPSAGAKVESVAAAIDNDKTVFTDPAPIALDADGRNKTEVTAVQPEKAGDIKDGQASTKLRFLRA